jgi:helicase
MRLKSLIKYDIPEMVIEAWTRRQGDYLLPLQEKAILNGLLSKNDSCELPNLLISAPTSTGKSFCGEMAAIGTLLGRHKVIMLLPLKSIAEEKYAGFRSCYHPLGIRTIIVTGDHPENDADFEFGNFDLALVVYEKFNRLLTVNLDILNQIGLIVIDELQMIGEDKRGPELELSLAKVIESRFAPRLIALSAVLHDETELAEWLGCNLIRETTRPVDLLQGIAFDGCFQYRSFNSGHEDSEEVPLSGNGDELTESLIDFLKADDGGKLVFLKTKRDTIEAAFKLAAVSRWKSAEETMKVLDGEETSFLIRALKQTLGRGVAFHNADLTARQRQAIENGYRRGEIKVIFSTPTLAMGVNLPAETVLLETMKYRSGDFGGRPYLIPVSVAEFQNITGRAGRFGLGRNDKPGRAIILARSDFEREVLWSEYIDNELKVGACSVLNSADIRNIVLDLVVSGLAVSVESLSNALASTFYLNQGGAFDRTKLETACENLISLNLIGKKFQPTPIGAAVAESGISVKSCRLYLESLNRQIPQTLPGWLMLALNGEDFDIGAAGLTSMEYRRRIYEKLCYREFSGHMSDIRSHLGLEIGLQPLSYRQTALLKAVFLLNDWAEAMPVDQLEQRYQLHLGQITDLASTAAWLLASIGKLIEAGDCNSGLPDVLDRFSFNVQFGINPDLRDIHAALGDVLNRRDLKHLADHGITSPGQLIDIHADKLAEILDSESRSTAVIKKIKNLEKEENMKTIGISPAHNGSPAVNFPSTLPFRPSIIELDGRYEKERYLVRIDGMPVRLTGKSFKYLTKLACSRLLANDGWIYKDDIEVGFNQARYLYRLKQEINRDGGIRWNIFENNRLGYYRLDLDPAKVRVNIGNLKNHPDFELREMAERLEPRLTN